MDASPVVRLQIHNEIQLDHFPARHSRPLIDMNV